MEKKIQNAPQRRAELKRQMKRLERNVNNWRVQLSKLKGSGKAPSKLKGVGLLKKESDSEGEDKKHASKLIKTEDDGSGGVEIGHKVEDGVKADHTGRKKIKTEGGKGSGIKIKFED